ncbi:MAG: hypothetical protein K6G08_04125 [Prevotella sp.]|nr:hypothetical protein [Prevotella sp.]
MNKRNLLGVIVVAIAMMGVMALSSCSHDDYVYNADRAEKTAKENYAKAFEKSFGTVGPNVDWGFSSKSASARATRAVSDYAQYRGNLKPDVTFPGDCEARNFLDAVPEGVNRLSPNGAGAGSYYIDAETQSVSTWAGASKIYVTGTVDLSEGDTNAATPKFAPDYRSEIYLLKGATLKLGEVSAIMFNVDAIYIAEGATLETAGLFKANTNTKVYNHGTIKVGTFEVNTSSFLYNVGTLTAGSVNAESNPSRIVNDGTINAATVVVNAGAVQNNDQWNVSGTTEINSNNSGWVNNGHWTTYDYAYVGGSWNVINNCFLEVENDFAMNISSEQGAFKIDGGGGVLTKYFDGGKSATGAVSGPFVIVMGPKAVFVVEETAILESGRGDENGFGIFGPTTGEYAVFQAKNIARDPYLESINSHGAVTYGGNLYISAETHFAQGFDSDGSGSYAPQPFIYEKNGFSIANNIYAEGFQSGAPDITIDETPCSPGFSKKHLYRVIAEDLSASEAGDFDFNDVVFDVVKAENGKTTLNLICAGGVLPLRVRGANQPEGVEIHGVFGEKTPNAKGEYKMYNTNAGPTVPVTPFKIEGEYTTPEEIRNIIIEVKKNNTWMVLDATRGRAACKILVDDTFIPVTEGRNIANEYQLFTNYVQGKFLDDFWWEMKK